MLAIVNQYNNVFDVNGCVKSCGRLQCIKLISMLEDYTGKIGNYGNIRTGMMDIENIKNFVSNNKQMA